MALVPIAITAHGRIGSLFERFLYGNDTLPPPTFAEDRPHASAAWRVATSPAVPSGILMQADKIWRSRHPSRFYGSSHKATTPSMWFNKQLGLHISTAVSAYLIRAHNKNKSQKHVSHSVDNDRTIDYISHATNPTYITPTSPPGRSPTGDHPPVPAVNLV